MASKSILEFFKLTKQSSDSQSESSSLNVATIRELDSDWLSLDYLVSLKTSRILLEAMLQLTRLYFHELNHFREIRIILSP